MRIESEGEDVSAPPKHLVFAYYVTGHGFGHATRVVEVLFLYLFFVFVPHCSRFDLFNFLDDIAYLIMIILFLCLNFLMDFRLL